MDFKVAVHSSAQFNNWHCVALLNHTYFETQEALLRDWLRGRQMRLFVLGMLVTLTPSALIMAWLLWQSAEIDMDVDRLM